MQALLRWSSLMLAFLFSSHVFGQAVPYQRHGKSYFYKAGTWPAEYTGTYLYEGKGEPIVQLNADGSGVFQLHGRPPYGVKIPIQWWLECDDQGNIQKQTGEQGRYQMIVVVKYGQGGGGNCPEGTFDAMALTVLPDLNRIAILGERWKALR